MAETIRQQIINAVIAALEEISIANGYETDIGTTVEDWPVNLQGTYDANELPVIGVFDVDNTTSREQLRAQKVKRELTIQARCYLKSTTPASECRKVLGDLEKALWQDETWGGLAVATMPSREGPDIKAESLEISAAVVEVVIHYITCTGNPYQ